jgi:hypothetical protein
MEELCFVYDYRYQGLQIRTALRVLTDPWVDGQWTFAENAEGNLEGRNSRGAPYLGTGMSRVQPQSHCRSAQPLGQGGSCSHGVPLSRFNLSRHLAQGLLYWLQAIWQEVLEAEEDRKKKVDCPVPGQAELQDRRSVRASCPDEGLHAGAAIHSPSDRAGHCTHPRDQSS